MHTILTKKSNHRAHHPCLSAFFFELVTLTGPRHAKLLYKPTWPVTGVRESCRQSDTNVMEIGSYIKTH